MLLLAEQQMEQENNHLRNIKQLKERIAAKRSDKFGFHEEGTREIQREIELINNFDCRTPKQNKKTQKSQD